MGAGVDLGGAASIGEAMKIITQSLGNFLQQAVLPKAVRHWTLTTLRKN
jgi:hypothetical protein